MESYKRYYHAELPVNDTYMTAHDAYDSRIIAINKLWFEISELQDTNDSEENRLKVQKLLEKIAMAEAIVCCGSFDEITQRGAIELLRLQAVFASFFASR
jgi:hypothetical protein